VLAEAFLHKLAAETDKPVHGFSNEALQVLNDYDWPGNIRELRNAVERSVLSCKGQTIEVSDLPHTILTGAGHAPTQATVTEPLDDKNLDIWLADVERRAILDALTHSNGVQAQAARRLGINERSLWHRIKKLGIQINRVVN